MAKLKLSPITPKTCVYLSLQHVKTSAYLRLQLVPLWALSLHLPVDVLLELLHVKQLEGFVQVQQTVGQLEDVVTDCRLLRRVLHVDVALADALHQDVARVVHLQLAASSDLGQRELVEIEIFVGCTWDLNSVTLKSLSGFSNPLTPILTKKSLDVIEVFDAT